MPKSLFLQCSLLKVNTNKTFVTVGCNNTIFSVIFYKDLVPSETVVVNLVLYGWGKPHFLGNC